MKGRILWCVVKYFPLNFETIPSRSDIRTFRRGSRSIVARSVWKVRQYWISRRTVDRAETGKVGQTKAGSFGVGAQKINTKYPRTFRPHFRVDSHLPPIWSIRSGLKESYHYVMKERPIANEITKYTRADFFIYCSPITALRYAGPRRVVNQRDQTAEKKLRTTAIRACVISRARGSRCRKTSEIRDDDAPLIAQMRL